MTKEQIEKKAKEIAEKMIGLANYSEYNTPDEQRNVIASAAKESALQMAQWVLSHQWVRVEDELPPLEKDVIVNFKWRNIENKRFGHRTDRPEVITDKNGFATFNDDEIITHWMPIPPMEKGGEK